MSSRAFYSLAISFFAGVFVVSIFDISFRVLGVIALIICACSFVSYIYNRKRVLILVFAASIAFIFGAWRMDVSQRGAHELDSALGTKVSLSGFVCDEPRKKEVTQSFCFFPAGSEDKILVTAGRYPEYFYGDILSVEGKLELPENFESYEGGPEFDYVSYLAKDGVRYTMFRPEIEKTSEGGGNPIVSALFALKGAFVHKMQLLFPEPESSLLGGLLLGDRSSMPKDITDEFKEAGLVHILVLSGYNVTIVAESLMKAFAFLPRTFAQSGGALSIVLFALMTGASATTVRASIMALIVILARSSSRRYDITRALLVAAFFMILHNPAILAFDVSFQLSFLATLSLIYVSPLVSERLGWVTERWKLREILSATIATQLFVFPFLIYAMGQISIISFVTNILVLPLVPYVMLVGFVAIALGFISSFLALPFAWVSSIILSYVLFIAKASALVPFASIHIQAGAFALACMYSFYAVYLIRAWRGRNSLQQSTN